MKERLTDGEASIIRPFNSRVEHQSLQVMYDMRVPENRSVLAVLAEKINAFCCRQILACSSSSYVAQWNVRQNGVVMEGALLRSMPRSNQMT